MAITTVVSLMVESAFHTLTFSQPVEAVLSAGQVARSLPTGLCVSTEPNQRPDWPIFGSDLVQLGDLTEKELRITFPYLDFES